MSSISQFGGKRCVSMWTGKHADCAPILATCREDIAKMEPYLNYDEGHALGLGDSEDVEDGKKGGMVGNRGTQKNKVGKLNAQKPANKWALFFSWSP